MASINKENLQLNKKIKNTILLDDSVSVFLIPFTGHNDKVFVTHIQNPCRFMVQSKADSSKLTTLSYSLNNWCNSPAADKQTVSAVEIGKYDRGQDGQ